MVTDAHTKQLVKILIGAAWLDGKIQPEERDYLHKVAQQSGVENDREIRPLLNELRAVKPQECYNWVQDYLGESPSQDDYQELIESISALIYSDGEVDSEEAKLLTRLQMLEPATTTSHKSAREGVLNVVQKLYRRWVDQQT